jgi:hypothetical protein
VAARVVAVAAGLVASLEVALVEDEERGRVVEMEVWKAAAAALERVAARAEGPGVVAEGQAVEATEVALKAASVEAGSLEVAAMEVAAETARAVMATAVEVAKVPDLGEG